MIYLLYKDRWERLKYQVEQCRKYIPHDDITVLHGPYRRNPYDSRSKIVRDESQALNITMEEIYACNPSSPHFRMIDLFNHCLSKGNALVIKDNIVPSSLVNYDSFSQPAGSHSSTPKLSWTLDWVYSREPIRMEGRGHRRDIGVDVPNDYNPFVNKVEDRAITTQKVANYLTQARHARLDPTVPIELKRDIKRLSRCGCHNGELERRWVEYLKSLKSK